MKNCAEADGAGNCLDVQSGEKEILKQQDPQQQSHNKPERTPEKTKELEAAALKLQLVATPAAALKSAQANAEKLQLANAQESAFCAYRNDELDDISLAAANNEAFNQQDEGQNLDSGYAWIILLVMFLLSASVGGASRVYGLIYAKQVAIGYYDHEEASWPIATASTIENLAGILTPALAVFLSWRKIQLLSTSLFILANVGAHFSSSLLIDIFCLGLIQGLALSINTVLALAINNDYFERYRTTAYGIIMSGSTCGTFVMGPVISWILEEFDNFRFAYLAIAAFFGLNIVLALFIVPRESAPNWTLCSTSQIGVGTTTTTSNKTYSNNKMLADLDDIRSQKSAAGGSVRALQHWPNRKVSQFASHFERKNSIASISVQCRISRQSSLSRNSSDWLGSAGGFYSAAVGGPARPNCRGSVRGVPRGISPNGNESPNFTFGRARSVSHQNETTPSSGASMSPSGCVGSPWCAGGGGGGGHKISVHSMHSGGYSSAGSRQLPSSISTTTAVDLEQARERALIRVASGGGALACMRKISQASKVQPQPSGVGGPLDGLVSAGKGGGESSAQEAAPAREPKKSVISIRAPAVAYELELNSRQQQQPRKESAEEQSECESLANQEQQSYPTSTGRTGQSDVTSSTATPAEKEKADRDRYHQHATPTRPMTFGDEKRRSLARGQQEFVPPPTTTCPDALCELQFASAANANSNKLELENNFEFDTIKSKSNNNYSYNYNYNTSNNYNDNMADEPERFNLASALNLLKLPYLHCVWIMLSLYYLIARIFIIILTDFADDHGLEMDQSRQLLNYWSLGEIFGRIFLSSFIDLQWLSVKSCIVLTCSALSASIALMIAIEGYYYVYALCSTLVAAFVSLEYMLINVLMVEYLGKSRVLGCYSLGSLLSSLLLFARPALIGLFRDQLGSYDGLLVLLAVLTLSYALLFGLLEPLLVRRWPKAAQAAQ